MTFLRQIFQDIDGCYSSKRAAFFVFVALFVGIAVLLCFHAVDAAAVPVLQASQDRAADLIKWLGGFIVSEQAVKFAPKREA